MKNARRELILQNNIDLEVLTKKEESPILEFKREWYWHVLAPVKTDS